jgi:hypothetical protein
MGEAFVMYRTTALFGGGEPMTGRNSGAGIADGPINQIFFDSRLCSPS